MAAKKIPERGVYSEETTLHLLGKCCALINQRREILGSHYLEYEDLALLNK